MVDIDQHHRKNANTQEAFAASGLSNESMHPVEIVDKDEILNICGTDVGGSYLWRPVTSLMHRAGLTVSELAAKYGLSKDDLRQLLNSDEPSPIKQYIANRNGIPVEWVDEATAHFTYSRNKSHQFLDYEALIRGFKNWKQLCHARQNQYQVNLITVSNRYIAGIRLTRDEWRAFEDVYNVLYMDKDMSHLMSPQSKEVA